MTALLPVSIFEANACRMDSDFKFSGNAEQGPLLMPSGLSYSVYHSIIIQKLKLV